MIVKKFTLGPVFTNVYLLIDKKSAILIDCQKPKEILKYLEKRKIKLKAILLTHGHFDHVKGSILLKEKLNPVIYMNKKDLTVPYGAEVKIDKNIKNNQILNINGLKVKVLFTPGHTHGSVSYYIKNKNLLFSGDTLFAKGIGRWDNSGKNYDNLINSLNKKLFKLPLKTKVLPGHGPNSNIKKTMNYLKPILFRNINK
ncbi:MAG: MBL fold metallo-hydrolase [Candidatus Nanoarchaeia archaeon]|nr:MBL fold metallo-hydrolase [Candidatus Nanoarchaeia archaeon]